MRSASIRTRMVLGLSILLALMVGQAILGVHYVDQQSRTSKEIATTATERVENVSHLGTELVDYRGSELGYVEASSPESIDGKREKLDELWGEIRKFLRRYRAVIDDPQRVEEYEAIVLQIDSYAAQSQQILTQAEAGERSEAHQLFASSQTAFDQMLAGVHQLRHEELDAASELALSARDSAARSRSIFLAIALLVVVVAVGLGVHIWYSLSGGLRRLLDATRRVSQGDLSRPVPISSGDEFGELARSFNAMLLDLKQSQEENTLLSQQSFKMQQERVQLLQGSLVKVVNAQEEERKRIARELHDQTGQALMALNWGLARLEREVSSSEAKRQVASLSRLTVETAEEIRNLALDLRPAALDELGLVPALRSYVKDFSKRVGIPIQLKVSGMECRLSPEAEVALFRTIQEALTNMAKHSRASQAKVVFKTLPTLIEVRIEDDGIGFEVSELLASSNRKSLGLFGIQERVSLLGGNLQIHSEPDKGTSIVVSVPLAG